MNRLNRTVGDNETFVTLIRVAQEIPDVRKTLIGILQQTPFQRRSLLNTLVDEMRMKGAPTEFVSAISALLDHDVAERAKELIQK